MPTPTLSASAANLPDTRRWGRIPAWWLDHPGLDADGFAVLAALATFADEDGLCWPSQSTLAAKLKRSRPTINRIIQGLSDIGLVGVEHRRGRDGARLSCLYRLRFTPVDAALESDVGSDRESVSARPVQPADRDDSDMHSPCPPASQEQVHSKQIPDSLASGGHGQAQTVPEDWMPTADDLAWAKARHAEIDLGRHVEGFILRCRAHGYRYRDVSSAWRAWLAQDAAAGKAPVAHNRPSVTVSAPATRPSAAAEQRLGAWAAAAAELRQRTATPSWS
ncbi:helix-turn-helix domain-containing protein [Azospirillum sp.]|uniref:helix-turn-helix domain-containing protein n=1 Tax=Azospirillum sp. TaxID=34012 RepID=UPI002D42C6E8|nr:helix-turn-helix domain-containing protein [Azospirillum sp.]HYF86543.1 helix-turn-helix domain-containing protein [Azospirillum sp.]